MALKTFFTSFYGLSSGIVTLSKPFDLPSKVFSLFFNALGVLPKVVFKLSHGLGGFSIASVCFTKVNRGVSKASGGMSKRFYSLFNGITQFSNGAESLYYVPKAQGQGVSGRDSFDVLVNFLFAVRRGFTALSVQHARDAGCSRHWVTLLRRR